MLIPICPIQEQIFKSQLQDRYAEGWYSNKKVVSISTESTLINITYPTYDLPTRPDNILPWD